MPGWVLVPIGLLTLGGFTWSFITFGLNEDPLEALAVTAGVLLGAFVAFTVLYALVMVIAQWVGRVAVERAVIGHVAGIIRQKLPLEQALFVAAQSEPGPAAGYLHAIAVHMSTGASLSQAIRLGWPRCPSIVLSLIMAGERAGQLPLAVEQAERYLDQLARRRARVDTPVTPYMIVVTAFTCLVTAGLMVVIVPKFKEIFQDYQTALPAMTVAYINMSRFLVEEPFMPFGWVVLGVAAIAGVYLWFRPRRVPEPHFMSRVADWFRWCTPGLHKLEWARGMAIAMSVIRMGLRAGMDLPPAARLAAEMDVNHQLRRRLRRFAQLISEGEELRLAAHQTGLGQVAGIALASGRRCADADTALTYATDYHNAVFSRAWIILGRLIWPVTTLALGVMVGFVVLAMFLPLVTLINAAGEWMR
ncbi:MAG: type II secretion system F family protein [Phycisphaerae bacterium]|jgi:type IV pilus assembly protein PilC